MAATGRETRSAQLYKILRWNLDSVRELPAPEYDWQWYSVVGPDPGDVHPRLAEKLKRTGGIRRSSRLDGHWETAPRLARYIEDRFSIELDDRGQATLPIDTPSTRTRDRDGDEDGDAYAGRQLDLTGRDVTPRVEQLRKRRRVELMRERRDGGRDGGVPTWMRAERDPQQLTLVDAAVRPVGIPAGLTRPAGDCYESGTPA